MVCSQDRRGKGFVREGITRWTCGRHIHSSWTRRVSSFVSSYIYAAGPTKRERVSVRWTRMQYAMADETGHGAM